MCHRSVREFERLLYRTELLTDTEDIKANIVVVESKLTELRNLNLLTPNQELEYTKTISDINQKIAPKTPIKKKKAKSMINSEEVSIAEEKKKQNQLTDEFMKLTEKLKDKVVEVGAALKDDQDVVENVQKSLDKNLLNSENVQGDLDDRISEQIGWKAYRWLAEVVIAYLLISFFFT